ncbi:hypothetical protein [Nocardioides sp.]|uniref:hypothetical protein n=1 Tax=Nocardioides sp. TaxID=35761 RepID=UPI00286C888D|nr:hypothetical protein [Nocardioides sp.]
MSRSLMTLSAAVVLALTLTGCGEDDVAADPAPADPSSSAPPSGTAGAEPADAAGPPCDVVTDEQLTDAAGTPQVVTGPTTEGLRTVCGTRVDPDDSLLLGWSLQEPDRTLAELVEEESDPGLAQEPLDLGGVEAVLMTGDFAGQPLARVVTVVDAGLLVVEATGNGLGDPRPEGQLVEIATQVAAAYAG